MPAVSYEEKGKNWAGSGVFVLSKKKKKKTRLRGRDGRSASNNKRGDDDVRY